MIELIAEWSLVLYAGAAIMALLALVTLCLAEWRDSRRWGARVKTGQEQIGRDQVTPERRQRLRELQYRVAQRDARRV